jgi:hypothetical protein
MSVQMAETWLATLQLDMPLWEIWSDHQDIAAEKPPVSSPINI